MIGKCICHICRAQRLSQTPRQTITALPKVVTKSVSRPSAKLLVLLALAMSGCVTLKRPPPSASETPVCASEAMAECDTTNPDLPPASELSADFAMDMAKFHQRQRDECAVLNKAKAACLRPTAPKIGKR